MSKIKEAASDMDDREVISYMNEVLNGAEGSGEQYLSATLDKPSRAGLAMNMAARAGWKYLDSAMTYIPGSGSATAGGVTMMVLMFEKVISDNTL